jgi:hypothetical protein
MIGGLAAGLIAPLVFQPGSPNMPILIALALAVPAGSGPAPGSARADLVSVAIVAGALFGARRVPYLSEQGRGDVSKTSSSRPAAALHAGALSYGLLAWRRSSQFILRGEIASITDGRNRNGAQLSSACHKDFREDGRRVVQRAAWQSGAKRPSTAVAGGHSVRLRPRKTYRARRPEHSDVIITTASAMAAGDGQAAARAAPAADVR